MKKTKGFLVKRPVEGKRASFAVVPYELDGTKRAYLPTLKDNRIKVVNEQLKSGLITLTRAEVLIQEIVAELYKKAGSKRQMIKRSDLLDDNQRVFQQFWEDVYGARILEDEASAIADYKRALKLLGDKPVITATAKEMHLALKTNSASEAQWRRAASTLNIILKHIGRGDVKLQGPREPVMNPTHITAKDLGRVLKNTPDEEMKILIRVLFSTGCRLSEALAIEPSDVIADGSQLRITKQLARGNKIKRPKRDSVGNVAVISIGRDALVQWAKVPNKARFRYSLYKHIKSVTRRLWPSDPIKQLSPHGLRHSHAIHLLSQGITLESVAKNLRDRIETCQRYYTGYIHTNSSLDALAERI